MDRQRSSTRQTGWGRYSRRRLLAGTGTAGMAGLFLAACGGSTSNNSNKNSAPAGGSSAAPSGGTAAAGGSPAAAGTAAASATAQIKRGGTFKDDLPVLTDVLDPHRSTASAASYFDLIGNEAFRIFPDGKQIEPVLVEKYEVPGDGTQIFLHARAGVKWHNRPPTNGRAFEAKDIVFNLMRIAGKLDPQHAAAYQRRSTLPNLDSVTAVDATTAQVKLTAPHSGFIRGLAAERNQFVPQELVDAQGDRWNDPSTFVGTGAFYFDTYQKDVKAVLKANPDYWEKGKPYLDGIEQYPVSADRLSFLSAFSQGQVDHFSSVTKSERDTLAKTFKGAQQVAWNFAGWDHFRFNVTRKPFGDPRVRQALQLVLDYKTMADGYYGDGYWDYTGPVAIAFPEAIPAGDIVKLPGWNPATKAQDTKTAKDLMTAAGYPDGNFSFKVFYSGTSDYMYKAIAAIDNWKTVWPAMGVTADPAPDGATFGTKENNGDFDMISYVIYPVPDALLDMQDNYSSNGGRNYGKYKDDQLDKLLDQAALQLDYNARAVTLKQIQDLLISAQACITTDQAKQVEYLSAKIRGLEGAGRPFGGGSRDILQAMKDVWIAS